MTYPTDDLHEARVAPPQPSPNMTEIREGGGAGTLVVTLARICLLVGTFSLACWPFLVLIVSNPEWIAQNSATESLAVVAIWLVGSVATLASGIWALKRSDEA